MGEMLAFLTVCQIFSGTCQGRIIGLIFTLVAHTTCFCVRWVLFGVRTIGNVICGKYTPKAS